MWDDGIGVIQPAIRGTRISEWPHEEGEWCTVPKPDEMVKMMAAFMDSEGGEGGMQSELDPFQEAIRDFALTYLEEGARSACHTSDKGITDSGGLSDRASMLRALAAGGRFHVVRQYGRMVVGYWPENLPKPDPV